MSQFFASGGQSIGVSASTSVLPVNTQDWSPLGWTGWISLQSKGLSRAFSTPQFKSINFLYKWCFVFLIVIKYMYIKRRRGSKGGEDHHYKFLKHRWLSPASLRLSSFGCVRGSRFLPWTPGKSSRDQNPVVLEPWRNEFPETSQVWRAAWEQHKLETGYVRYE